MFLHFIAYTSLCFYNYTYTYNNVELYLQKYVFSINLFL